MPEAKADLKPARPTFVRRINSTWLELEDLPQKYRGVSTGITLLFLFIIGVAIFGAADIYAHPYRYANGRSGGYVVILVLIFLLLPGLALTLYGCAIVDYPGYKAYPLRLNRKTGRAYLFMGRKGVLIRDWRDLFFCLGTRRLIPPAPGEEETARGILDAAAMLAVATSDVRTLNHVNNLEQADRNSEAQYYLYCHALEEADGHITASKIFGDLALRKKSRINKYWEFIRQYMENGPDGLPLEADDDGNPALSTHKLTFNIVMSIFLIGPLLPLIAVTWLVHKALSPVLNKPVIWPADLADDFAVAEDDPHVHDYNRESLKKKFLALVN